MDIFDDETLGSHVGPFTRICSDLKDLYYCRYEEPITDEELDELEALTWLKRHQIIEAFDLFAFHSRNLETPPSTSLCVTSDVMFKRIRSFSVCPWTDRLKKIFSHDDSKFTFNEWMDMFNAYNKRTPVEFKIGEAFRIFDFDDDGFISVADVVEYLKRLTDGVLPEYFYVYVAEEVVYFYDYDKDKKIGLMDFQLGLRKDLDFEDEFCLSIWLNRNLCMLDCEIWNNVNSERAFCL